MVVAAMLNVLFAQLFWPIFFIIIAVFLVRWLMAYGGLQTNALGYDMTVFTYGFLCDLIVRAFQGRDYWQQYPEELMQWGITKTKILAVMAVSVLGLLIASMKIEKRLAGGNPGPSLSVRWFYRIIIFLCGLLITVLVVGADAFWDSVDV